MPQLPNRWLQRDRLSRLAVSALQLRGEPAVRAQVWSRSPSELDVSEAYSPTGAALALPVRDLADFVALLEGAARDVTS